MQFAPSMDTDTNHTIVIVEIISVQQKNDSLTVSSLWISKVSHEHEWGYFSAGKWPFQKGEGRLQGGSPCRTSPWTALHRRWCRLRESPQSWSLRTSHRAATRVVNWIFPLVPGVFGGTFGGETSVMLCGDHFRISHQLSCCQFPGLKDMLESPLPCISGVVICDRDDSGPWKLVTNHITFSLLTFRYF